MSLARSVRHISTAFNPSCWLGNTEPALPYENGGNGYAVVNPAGHGWTVVTPNGDGNQILTHDAGDFEAAVELAEQHAGAS